MDNIEILQGDSKEQLTQIYINEIEQEFSLICQDENIDMEELKKGNERNARLYRHILIHIGKNLFKGTNKLKDKSKSINGFYNTYDIVLLSLLMDYYIDLCGLYNKAINKVDYCNLLGMHNRLFVDNNEIDEILNDKHCNLSQKIMDAQREDLENTFQNSNQAVKNIAYMNYKYNWGNQSNNTDKVNVTIKLDSLPQFKIGQKE